MRTVGQPAQSKYVTFRKSARPQCVDPALLALHPDTTVRYEENFGTSSGFAWQRIGAVIAEIEEQITRQVRGFFRVDEAARVMANENPSIDVPAMIERLKNASINGRRLARNPGDHLPIVEETDFREYASLVSISDVDVWLTQNGAGYTFPNQDTIAAKAPATAAPIPKQRAQEFRIIELLKAKGYSPLSMTQRAPGKPGQKAEIRTLALKEAAMFTSKTFDTAWQRLRDAGRIAEAD